jgi:hypothetical protein
VTLERSKVELGSVAASEAALIEAEGEELFISAFCAAMSAEELMLFELDTGDTEGVELPLAELEEDDELPPLTTWLMLIS